MRTTIFVLFIISIWSCNQEMPPPPYDCNRENFFSRFERLIYDPDSSSAYYHVDIIRLRYDRIFSHLVGTDCPPNRPDVKCVGGDFYIYNLLNDSIEFYMTYSKMDGLSNIEYHKLNPQDSLVILNDPLICEKNSPGFKFYYK